MTKQASDLIILDNNFATIVAAIFEGRKIVGNVRKVIVYLFSSVLDELFLIGGSLLLGLALPLNALQILFVNFFSDSFPAIAFAFEEGVDDHSVAPRRRGRNILDRTMRVFIFVIGGFSIVLLFILYYSLLWFGYPLELVQSFIFASFATYTLIVAFSLRSLEKSILRFNPFSNLYLTSGVLFGIFLTFAAVYIPFLQKIFHTVSLPFSWFILVFCVGVFNVTLIELAKYILHTARFTRRFFRI